METIRAENNLSGNEITPPGPKEEFLAGVEGFRPGCCSGTSTELGVLH